MNRARKSVFIVDDHPLFRQALTDLIHSELGDVRIAGEAADAVHALERILQTECNAVVVDLGLPGRSGMELVRDVHTMRPEVGVMVLSGFDETLYAERALRCHARAYVMKHEPPEVIVQALRAVLAGEVWFSRQISSKLFDVIAGRERVSSTCKSIERLTDRELEVLRLIGQGKRNKEIASALNLSPKTVDVHRCHIREKLGIKSGPELVCYAAHWAQSTSGGEKKS